MVGGIVIGLLVLVELDPQGSAQQMTELRVDQGVWIATKVVVLALVT